MSRNGSFFPKLVGVLLIIGLLVAAGVFGYQSGVSQGIAQSPAVAAAIANAQQAGQAVPAVPGYANGYYPGAWMSSHFGFFSFGSILGIMVFGLLFLMALRLIFRPRYWHPAGPMGMGAMHGFHSRHWGPPPWAKDYPQEKSQEETQGKSDLADKDSK